MFTQILRSALCGIAALLMFLGGLWLFQRETMIILTQEQIIKTLNTHQSNIGQITEFLNQQIQASKEANERLANFNKQPLEDVQLKQPQKAS